MAQKDPPLALLEAEIAALQAELQDLQSLYDTAMAHGEYIENCLSETNEQLEKAQKRIREELDEAAQYLKSLLPKPFENPFFKIDWHYEPSSELSGDTFGYHTVDDTHWAFYLIDVCGHGVRAALLSAAVLHAIRSQLLPNVDFADPSKVFAALNTHFSVDDRNGMFFTIWYGVYETTTRQLRYASAGHPPALLLRTDHAAQKLYVPEQIIIGYAPDTRYTAHSCQLQRGDRLLICSDGTYEWEDHISGKMLTFDDFSTIVDDLYAKTSPTPTALIQHCRTRARNATAPFADDVSVLQVEFN